MRMLLQYHPDGSEPPRFVQLTLQPDLLGGWILLRESGQTGGKHSLRRGLYLDHASALVALERARDQQLRRGFQLTFTDGVPAQK